MKKAFGIPIEKAVYKQLEARKAVLKQDSRVVQRNMLQHNKGAWVRVVSGVDTKVGTITAAPEAAVTGDTAEKDIYSEELASNFVLQGGVLKPQTATDGKRSFELREGLELRGNFLDHNGAYSYDDTLGYRPMPGITDFTVQSQGSFGTLKKSDIQFKVWSLEHLNSMEQLYFRPGFNILIEYGSAAFLDSESEELEVNTLEYSLADEYLKRSKTLAQLDAEIDKLELKTCFNYSGFLGRIVNFSWSYNTDGGFDCSIQIQARGEIVESLKLLMEDNSDSGLNSFSTSTPSKMPEFTFLKGLKALKGTQRDAFAEKYLLDIDGEFDKDEFIVTSSNRFNVEGLETQADENSKYKVGRKYDNDFKFMTLGTLLTLINNFCVIENEKGEKETSFRTKRYENKHSCGYITFPGHVALNPLISMLPFKSEKGVYMSDLELYGAYTDQSVQMPNEISGDKLESTNIYHILINIDYIIELVESLYKGKDNTADINVFSFLKTVLGKLNSNQGSINNLDLDLDKRVNEWRVVDRDYYDPEKSSGDSYSELDLVGLGSLVTNFSLETKISGALTNMLAISAAVSGNDGDLDSMSRYNMGLKDRFKDSVYTGVADKPVEDDSASKEETQKHALEAGSKVANCYSIYNKSKKLDITAFENTKISHTSYTEKAYKLNQKSIRQSGKKASYKGIIPMNLSLTIDGISGLKVGEAFRINNSVLPSSYHNRVGFIITGLADKIGGDSKWSTEITTKMFNLPSTEKADPTFLKLQSKLAKQKEARRIIAARELKAYKAVNQRGQEALKAKYGLPGEGPFSKIEIPKGLHLFYGKEKHTTIGGVHTSVATPLQNAFSQLADFYGGQKGLDKLKISMYHGYYNKRQKRGGTSWSTHAFGIAIDLFKPKNELSGMPAPIAYFSKPEYKAVQDIFERNGFYSLGRAKNYDYMHFQAWDPGLSEKTGAPSNASRLAGRPYGATSAVTTGWELPEAGTWVES